LALASSPVLILVLAWFFAVSVVIADAWCEGHEAVDVGDIWKNQSPG
jgi:hypothetical protein